jgi:hypothetical protein
MRGNFFCTSEFTGIKYWYHILVGKPQGKRQIWRPRHRWQGSIKMDLRGVGCKHVNWIPLAWDRILL